MKRVPFFFQLVILLALLSGLSLKAGQTDVNFSGSGTVTVDDVVMFYDDGGPSGKYTTNTYGSMTFVAPQGKSLKMTFLSFYTHDDDHLLIYDGTKASGTPLADMAGYYYDDQMAAIVSQSQPGALTVVFDPEKNKKFAGWEIRIEAFSASPLAVGKVKVSPVNDIKLMRGSVNNRMLHAKVTIDGDQGTINLTRLQFSALQSDLSALSRAKVWYTGQEETFGTYSLYGECAPASDLVFDGSLTFDKATEANFWLTYDIAPDAQLGSKIQVGNASVTAGDKTVEADSESTSALTTVQEGMHGTYTVGTSGSHDFASISEAVTALTSGIDGAVTLELADGNYRELVNVPPVTGASAVNTITIRAAGGDPEKVVITYDTYTNPGSSHYDKRYGVFTFDGVNYLTLSDVTVTSGTYSGFPGIVYLRNASRNCTVKNCIIKAPASTDLAYGTNLVYMYTGNVANSNCDNFTLEDCTLDGGLIGVTLGGTSSTKYDKQRGGRIIGNTFMNQGSKGIYLSYERDASICGNTVIMGKELTSSYYALDLSAFEGNLEVGGNRVVMDTPRQSAVGMYLRTYSSEASKYADLHVYNNSLNLLNVSSAVTGIRVNNDIPGLELVHNTINIEAAEGENPYAVGVFFGGSLKGGRFVNNIVQNNTSGYGIQLNREEYAANSGIAFSNNTLYSANASNLIYMGGSGANAGAMDFDKWMTLGYDKDSFCEPVAFESTDCLRPVKEGNLCNGTPVNYVTYDLAGKLRDSSKPTIGAYEISSSAAADLTVHSRATFNLVGRSLKLNGATAPCTVNVYSLQGTIVKTTIITDCADDIDLSELARGVYIATATDLNHHTVASSKIVLL